jgi:cohesin loading factor subunit SCC2
LKSARELTAATWGHELALALKQYDSTLSLLNRQADHMITFGEKVKEALYDVWKDTGSDVFDIGYDFGLGYQSLYIRSSSGRRKKLHA